jgi:hypothetical protein
LQMAVTAMAKSVFFKKILINNPFYILRISVASATPLNYATKHIAS